MDELKPCPFCGTTWARPFHSRDEFGRLGYGVQCTGSECSIIGPQHETPEEAAVAWNTRATNTLIAELMARCEHAEAEVKRLNSFIKTTSRLVSEQHDDLEAELTRLRAVGTFNEGIAAAASDVEQKAREIRNLSTTTAFAIAAILQEMVDRIRSLHRS